MTAACVALVCFCARNWRLKQSIVLQSETQSSAPQIFGVKSEICGSGSQHGGEHNDVKRDQPRRVDAPRAVFA